MKLLRVSILFCYVITSHCQVGRNSWRLNWWRNGIRGEPPINSYEHLGINPSQLYAHNPHLRSLLRRSEYMKRLLYGRAYTPYHRLPGTRYSHQGSNRRQPRVTSIRQPHCQELFVNGTTMDGMYDILANGRRLQVYCQFTANQSWLVIQRRLDGSTSFQQNFSLYENGFGAIEQEFWIGLANLYDLLRFEKHMLRIEIEDFDGVRAFAEYDEFDIDGFGDNYRLYVNGYRGSAGNALRYHNGYPFSTVDRDRDSHYRRRSCAEVHGGGGWWYNDCLLANLNGEYIQGGVSDIRGIVWHTWKNNHYSMRSSEMKIRPISRK